MHNWNIEHLTFEMVNHNSEWSHNDVIQEVYKITTLNKDIGTFWWFVSDIVEKAKSNHYIKINK